MMRVKQASKSSQTHSFIMSFATFSLLAALAATASAHGYVDNATIAGVEYTVNPPCFVQ